MDVLDKIRTPDWNRVFQDWPCESFVQHGENLCVSNANRAFNCTKCFVHFINSHANVNAPREIFCYRDTEIFKAIDVFERFTKSIIS